MCVALRGRGGRASAGNLLQGAQRRLQGDCDSVADGLRVVRHRVTGTLGQKKTKRLKECYSSVRYSQRPAKQNSFGISCEISGDMMTTCGANCHVTLAEELAANMLTSQQHAIHSIIAR